MIQTKRNMPFYFLFSILVLVSSCKKDNNEPAPSIYSGDETLGITSVPVNLGKDYTKYFDRYTKVTTPNGGSIHICAQSLITNEQIIRSRGILEHYLTAYPGSEYGSNKDAVANKMADNGAKLLLLNGQDDGSNPLELDGQYLFQNEIQVEGHSWYVQQNYEHRDASFEEILHLVHDYGIGVDGPNSAPGAAPEFQQEIRSAQVNAQEMEIWGKGATEWLNELSQENSLSQEYLASLIDCYYGLWGAWQEHPSNGMWGFYLPKTREEIATEDPMGQELLNHKFFHPYLTYNARIDAEFTGTFSLKFNAEIPYSHHSQYLKDITLLGSLNTNVIVNELDNNITGNEGENTIIFTGDYSEYSISSEGEFYMVTDQIENRDGQNTLSQVEKLQFNDQTIEL
jgi:hypothetical protein